jgi:hypothetical protein
MRVCKGDYVINSVSDLLLVSDCTSITGSLTLNAGTSVRFPVLASVGGSFEACDPALTSLQLPVLGSVGGSFGVLCNAKLTSLELPVLASVRGDLVVEGTQPASPQLQLPQPASLQLLQLPLLASVGGMFSIDNNTDLTSLQLPVLASVGYIFRIHNNPALTSLELPVLASVEGGGCSFPGRDLGFRVYDNPALTSLVAPMLAVGRGCACYFVDNALPTCQATALSSACTSGTAIIWGNNDLGTCP